MRQFFYKSKLEIKIKMKICVDEKFRIINEKTIFEKKNIAIENAFEGPNKSDLT